MESLLILSGTIKAREPVASQECNLGAFLVQTTI